MLVLENLSFGYTDQLLFKDVNVEINRYDKIGFVGRNGSGKTTLLKIIAGEIDDFYGTRIINPNIEIGFLPQDINFIKEGESAFSLCKKAFSHIENKFDELSRLSSQIEDPRNQEQYDRILSELSVSDDVEFEHKIKIILSNLGFLQSQFDKDLTLLSSGFKVRAFLGYLMLFKPDILILDEPTNYLDIDAIKFLLDFLKNYEGAFIIVSHDKQILDTSTNKIWDLYAKKLYIYNGCNYTDFLSRKEQYLTNLEAQAKNQQQKINQQMKFIERFRYTESKASAVQSRIKQLEKIEKVEIPRESNISFAFHGSTNQFSNILSCENLTFGYDNEENENILLDNIHFSIIRDDKIFLIGRNGIGKTTFIKLLVGELQPKRGKVTRHNNSKIGYFEQNNTFFTLENTNLFDYFASSDFAASMSLQQIKSYLGQFGFSGDDVYKDISVLSGGEKVRLLLAKILYPQPDILILDEPTTHLDITTKEILIENLKSFSGALFIVSHDIDFIVRLANKYITIINKNLVNLDDISDYFLLKDLSKENVLRIKNKDNKENSKKNILSTNKRQQIQKEIEEIELQLKDIESQMQKLQYQFSIKNDYESISNLSSEYKRLENKYENLFNRLNELEQMLN